MIARGYIPPDLLEDVKNRLNITWSDQATDKRIRGLIAEGTAYLDSKAGTAMEYQRDGLARTLLMEYARYARDEALDVFENNYRHMILAMQAGVEVRQIVEETAETVGGGDAAVQ